MWSSFSTLVRDSEAIEAIALQTMFPSAYLFETCNAAEQKSDGYVARRMPPLPPTPSFLGQRASITLTLSLVHATRTMSPCGRVLSARGAATTHTHTPACSAATKWPASYATAPCVAVIDQMTATQYQPVRRTLLQITCSISGCSKQSMARSTAASSLVLCDKVAAPFDQ